MKYGPNTETVEAFIKHLKGMTKDQWGVVIATLDASRYATVFAAWHVATDAAHNVTQGKAGRAAWEAAQEAARGKAVYGAWETTREATHNAVYEILGGALMHARNQPFFFLPLFGFDSPEAVLAADQAN